MPESLVIYYGTTGLEEQIFHTYMASAGYRVQAVKTLDDLYNVLDANSYAVVVIAIEASSTHLTEIAHEVAARAERAGARFPTFLLTDVRIPGANLDDVQVISHPLRLSELIYRIRLLPPNP